MRARCISRSTLFCRTGTRRIGVGVVLSGVEVALLEKIESLSRSSLVEPRPRRCPEGGASPTKMRLEGVMSSAVIGRDIGGGANPS
jgi:hypothetical protein